METEDIKKYMQDIGSKGGKATFDKYGAEYFRMLGKKSLQKKRDKKEQEEDGEERA